MADCFENGKKVVQEVLLVDHTTPPVELFFVDGLATTTLASATAINDLTIDLVDDTGFVDGDYIGVFSASDRFYFATQIGASAAGTVTFDTPLDFAFAAGDRVSRTTRNMAVDGSGTTRVFAIQGSGDPASNLQIDITRIILLMVGDNSPPPAGVASFDLSTFGNIAGGITNGIVLRLVNGTTQNIFNAKTNGDLSNISYDIRIDSGAIAGSDALTMRLTFAGQDKHGVALRLRAGDSLEVLIQDDLSLLTTMSIVAEGHRAD